MHRECEQFEALATPWRLTNARLAKMPNNVSRKTRRPCSCEAFGEADGFSHLISFCELSIVVFGRRHSRKRKVLDHFFDTTREKQSGGA